MNWSKSEEKPEGEKVGGGEASDHGRKCHLQELNQWQKKELFWRTYYRVAVPMKSEER